MPALVGLVTFGVLVLGPRRAVRILAKPRSAVRSCATGEHCRRNRSRRPRSPATTEPKHAAVPLPALPEVQSQ